MTGDLAELRTTERQGAKRTPRDIANVLAMESNDSSVSKKTRYDMIIVPYKTMDGGPIPQADPRLRVPFPV